MLLLCDLHSAMLVSLEPDYQQLAYDDTDRNLLQWQSLIILTVTDVPA